MKRTLIAVIWMVMLATARGADIATTYHFCPTLLHEANPIVSVLGGGWIALLVPNFLLCIFFSLCTIAYWRAKPYFSLVPYAQSPWDFAMLGLYGKKMTKRAFICRQLLGVCLPPRGHRAVFCQLAGFAVPPVIITGSFIAVFAWYATCEWHLAWFIQLHSHLSYTLVLVPCLLVWFAAEVVYFTSEYRRACSVNPIGTA